MTKIRRDDKGNALIGVNGEFMADVRGKLSGLHFSQEALTEGERRILYLAECVLHELDRQNGGFFR